MNLLVITLSVFAMCAGAYLALQGIVVAGVAIAAHAYWPLIGASLLMAGGVSLAMIGCYTLWQGAR
jgi:hypothetical protein